MVGGCRSVSSVSKTEKNNIKKLFFAFKKGKFQNKIEKGKCFFFKLRVVVWMGRGTI